MTLDNLGERICIMGTSNSGKSMLANAIARVRRLSPIHLDQLFHLPKTDWQSRALDEFVALHDAAIRGESSVIDGNYSQSLPQRLDRTTGIILLDLMTVTSLFRYLRRSWFERYRHGAIECGRDSCKWMMIRHILATARDNRKRYREMLNRIDLPSVTLATTRETARF